MASNSGAASSGHRGPGATEPNVNEQQAAGDGPPRYTTTEQTPAQPYPQGTDPTPPSPVQQPTAQPPGFEPPEGDQLPQAHLRGDDPDETPPPAAQAAGPPPANPTETAQQQTSQRAKRSAGEMASSTSPVAQPPARRPVQPPPPAKQVPVIHIGTPAKDDTGAACAPSDAGSKGEHSAPSQEILDDVNDQNIMQKVVEAMRDISKSIEVLTLPRSVVM